MSYSSGKTLYAVWLNMAQQQAQRTFQEQQMRQQEEVRQEEIAWNRKQQILQNARQMGQDAERIRQAGFDRKMKMAELQGKMAAQRGEQAPTYTDSRFDQYADLGYGAQIGIQNQEQVKADRDLEYKKALEEYEQSKWLEAQKGKLSYADTLSAEKSQRELGIDEELAQRGLRRIPGGGFAYLEKPLSFEEQKALKMAGKPRPRAARRISPIEQQKKELKRIADEAQQAFQQALSLYGKDSEYTIQAFQEAELRRREYEEIVQMPYAAAQSVPMSSGASTTESITDRRAQAKERLRNRRQLGVAE